MTVVQDAESDGEEFAGGDDEGDEVLLELLDHSVDEHLTDCVEQSHRYQVRREPVVVVHEADGVDQFVEGDGQEGREDEDPLVDKGHELNSSWAVDRLDLSLEVRQKPVGQQRKYQQ